MARPLPLKGLNPTLTNIKRSHTLSSEKTHIKMSEAMDIDTGYDTREREASPRRDRDVGGRRDNFHQRDRSPQRRGYGRGDSRGGFNDRRRADFRRGRPDDIPLENLKDSYAASGGRDTDRNYGNSVFIGNLGFDCDSQAIREYFSKAGDVVRADVITQGGRHRGMATVEFSSREAVQTAIREFHHSRFGGREIFVREDNPPPGGRNDRGGDRGHGEDRFGGRGGDRNVRDRFDNRDSGYGRDRFDRGGDRSQRQMPSTGPFYEVFVGNLPFRYRWQDLKDLFRESGHVLNATIKEDEYTGKSRGFGFVYFEKHEDALSSIEKFNGYELDGRTIDVREGKKSSAGGDSTASRHKNSPFTEGVEANGEPGDLIHVNNLPFATTNQDLLDLFGSIGTVVKAEIVIGPSGRPAGSAVVQYESAELAESCISKLNNYDYGGRGLKITYAKRP